MSPSSVICSVVKCQRYFTSLQTARLLSDNLKLGDFRHLSFLILQIKTMGGSMYRYWEAALIVVFNFKDLTYDQWAHRYFWHDSDTQTLILLGCQTILSYFYTVSLLITRWNTCRKHTNSPVTGVYLRPARFDNSHFSCLKAPQDHVKIFQQ